LSKSATREGGKTYLGQDPFPAELQRNGYYTGQFGKYLNNWDKKQEGNAGFDVFKNDYHRVAQKHKERSKADILTARRGARFVKDRESSDDKPWMMTLSLRS